MYLPGCALPDPTAEDEGFWEATRRHELRIQRCMDCDRLRFPPRSLCPYCYSRAYEWHLLPGTGVLFSYTFVHHIVEDAFKARGPYNVAVVELDGTEGIRIVTNVVDLSEDQMAIGMAVEVAWEDHDDEEVTLPRFRSKRGCRR